MKLTIKVALAPLLLLASTVMLPACQTSTGKADATKATTPTFPPRTEPISAATAANMGNNCFSCHGPDGRSSGSIPSLRGKSAEMIVKRMNDFKSGALPSTVMGRHAKGYTDAEIVAIANYISSFK